MFGNNDAGDTEASRAVPREFFFIRYAGKQQIPKFGIRPLSDTDEMTDLTVVFEKCGSLHDESIFDGAGDACRPLPFVICGRGCRSLRWCR